MVAFPILLESDLPARGTTCERPDVEFKHTVPPEPGREKAKDLCALANTIGGSIIIGSEVLGTQVTGYPGNPANFSAQLPNSYEQSAKDWCRPGIRLSSQVIQLRTGTAAVAINVWPSPLAPVGVRWEKKGDDQAWIFPIRIGSQTKYLAPDEFGTLENVSARRAAALLQGIPPSPKPKIYLRWTTHLSATAGKPLQHHSLEVELTRLDAQHNAAVFQLASQPKPVSVPLDWIGTIWMDELGAWIVGLSCSIDSSGPNAALHAVPPGTYAP